MKIIALDMIWASKKEMDSHYPKDEAWIKRLGEKSLANYQQYGIDPKEKLGTDDLFEMGKMIRKWVVEYMTSGPVVKGLVSGVHATDMVRKICGNSLPNLADMGTIREIIPLIRRYRLISTKGLFAILSMLQKTFWKRKTN